METIVAGLITGAVAVCVCIINNIYQSQNLQTQHDKTVAIIEYKIESLEKKVDKHNNVVERMIAVERDLKTSFNIIDELKESISDLQKK